uniref:Lipoyltransferase 1, mitochondrial-like n=1 Tax=Saccoglossus kowalevskii TaxID=10224 RepID=A0ABM0MHM2_SACKO
MQPPGPTLVIGTPCSPTGTKQMGIDPGLSKENPVLVVVVNQPQTGGPLGPTRHSYDSGTGETSTRAHLHINSGGAQLADQDLASAPAGNDSRNIGSAAGHTGLAVPTRRHTTNKPSSVPLTCMEALSRLCRRKGIVYCSTSTDVYANLAFEDWAYENWNFSDVHMLLLWRNDASVVIGRHQNPWNECDIPKLQHHNVKLARRKSGGGAVYHDLGNLNISFFTSRKKYDRRANLTLIMTALQNSWPHIDINLSHRDDLMLNKDYKISGSAAKLGRTTAYHHCTLLFDVNTSLLNDILQSHL